MTKMDRKVLVVASAGGHLTQAMCATASCNNLVLVSNKLNLIDDRVKRAYKIWDTQHNALIHLFNIFFALYVLLKERPKTVFSTGGPIVLPFALLCKVLPFRFVYLDTLSRVVELSNTGKLIKKYGLYDQFLCQWPNVAKENNVECLGKCFDILGENSTSVERRSSASKPLILVTIGTNDYPFSRALEYISKMPLYRDPRVRWVMQVGANLVEELPENGEVISSVDRNKMEQYVKEASLVISHCGIGSINMMLRYQKRVVFIPRLERFGEFSDDHQLQIANELNNPLLTVCSSGDELPFIDFEQLKSFGLVDEAVDITNWSFSARLKQELRC